MNVSIVAYASTWPVFINTLEGIRGVEPLHEHTGRIFRLRRWTLIRKIMLPSALPLITSGLRIGLGIALAVTIFTEMVSSGRGLGYLLVETSMSDRIAETYAIVLVTGVIGYGVNEGFSMIRTRLMPWQEALMPRERLL